MSKIPLEQVPGVRHRRVGDIVVTAISDGSVDGRLDVLRNIDQEEARRILAESFRPAGRTPINAFLLYSAGRLALVETGSGNYLGLTAGKVLANIAAAGVDPASIETVLLYHMHPDHSAGLSDGDRTPLFLQRRTGRARERTAALVRRRRHGEGVRAPAAALFHVCAGADHAVQGPHASVSKGRCVSGRHRHPVPRQHAGAHVVPHQFRQRATADLGRHGARAGDPDRTSGSALEFDIDPDAAAVTRRRVFDMVATDRLPITGMHLHFPGFAHLVRRGSGYQLVPEAWEQTL
jgi:proteasome lid subunit RPN8/RPN11